MERRDYLDAILPHCKQEAACLVTADAVMGWVHLETALQRRMGDKPIGWDVLVVHGEDACACGRSNHVLVSLFLVVWEPHGIPKVMRVARELMRFDRYDGDSAMIRAR